MDLRDDEKPLKEPFWKFSSFAEAETVRNVLKRRFPETFAILAQCLEEADPFDIVYPNNPDEYDDVIDEIIVLLAPVDGDLGKLTERQLAEIIRTGLDKCFGEKPEEVRVQDAVRLISRRTGRKS